MSAFEMKDTGEQLSDLEKSAINSLHYWQNVADTDTDPKIVAEAKMHVGRYTTEVLWFDRARERRQNMAAKMQLHIPPPPLTPFEMACAPLYVAQVGFQYLFLGGLWTIIAFAVVGLLIGGSLLK